MRMSPHWTHVSQQYKQSVETDGLGVNSFRILCPLYRALKQLEHMHEYCLAERCVLRAVPKITEDGASGKGSLKKAREHELELLLVPVVAHDLSAGEDRPPPIGVSS